ncbi:MAG: cation:proton antiporter, partial [Deltaproteobacteria bacterium]|nr:cation:proton antiporter [Deltaproteobacteria bacterium]
LTWLEEVLKTWVSMSALLGVMTIGFIILEKSEIRAHKMSQKLAKVWIFAEILLFVLVGAQVNISVAWHAGLAGACLIFIALIGRCIGTYFSVMGTDLNLKERMFCVIAYIPKATVQAAIGAVPLEAGIKSGDTILAVAVLSILLTAPLGAIGIQVTGNRWLEQEPKDSRHKAKTV